jgi:hypothetical protein
VNYTLQLDLGDGFNKADETLDRLLDKISKIGNLDNLKMDKDIDESGFLKAGENIGAVLADGMSKGVKSKFKGVTWNSKEMLGNPRLPETPEWLNNLKSKPALDFKKIFTGILLGTTNPYIGSRVLSDELGKKLPAAGSGGGIASGLFGKGGIAGFSEIFLAFKSFKIAVDIFKVTIENARMMYSKALQNGMGLNFSIRRGALAEIMGVSEADVFRFGAQMAYLNKQLDFSVSVLARTTKSLTELSWGLKITGYDFKALSAQFFDGMAPAINELIDDFNSFLETLGKMDFLKESGQVLNVIFIALGDIVGLFEVIVSGFVTGLHFIGDSFSILIMDILNLLSHIPGLKSLGGWDTSKAAKDMETSAQGTADLAEKVWKNKFGKETGNVPNPQAWMKQLPASSIEKMGFVTMGGSQNYAKDTAKNTNKMAAGIAALVKIVGKGSGNPNFGMSSKTANP